jgi:hypothetical protein
MLRLFFCAVHWVVSNPNAGFEKPAPPPTHMSVFSCGTNAHVIFANLNFRREIVGKKAPTMAQPLVSRNQRHRQHDDVCAEGRIADAILTTCIKVVQNLIYTKGRPKSACLLHSLTV